MGSKLIGNILEPALKRNGMSQHALGVRTNKTRQTINGYVKNRDRATLDSMEEIATAMKDSQLAQDFSHLVFEMIPPMDSDVYELNPFTIEILEEKEIQERDSYKPMALEAMAKRKDHLTQKDIDALEDYAFNMLDVVFVQLRHVIEILSKLDMSLMQAVKRRKATWQMKKYIRG
jgi:transcriptional regulator with XRE-family HTH domain